MKSEPLLGTIQMSVFCDSSYLYFLTYIKNTKKTHFPLILKLHFFSTLIERSRSRIVFLQPLLESSTSHWDVAQRLG